MKRFYLGYRRRRCSQLQRQLGQLRARVRVASGFTEERLYCQINALVARLNLMRISLGMVPICAYA